MLEAILDGDSASYGASVSALPGDRTFRVLGVAASAVLFRKWPDQDPSLQAVADYVDQVTSASPPELPVSGAVVEAVIRGVFGETNLLDEASATEIVGAEVLLIRSVGSEVLVSSAERDTYLDEVLSAVD